MYVIKRDKSKEEFNSEKIKSAMHKAFVATNQSFGKQEQKAIDDFIRKLESVQEDDTTVESIQDDVERFLTKRWFRVGKAYMLYREQHKMERFIEERLDYMDSYSENADNAATASETDPNSNVSTKNVATLDPEVYKTTNRNVQRRRMKRQLKKDFPEEDI